MKKAVTPLRALDLIADAGVMLKLTPHALADLWAISKRTTHIGLIEAGENTYTSAPNGGTLSWKGAEGANGPSDLDLRTIKNITDEIPGLVVRIHDITDQTPSYFRTIRITNEDGFKDFSNCLSENMCRSMKAAGLSQGLGKKLRVFGAGYIPHFRGVGTPAIAGVNY